MITENCQPYVDVSEAGFAALDRRLEGLPPSLAGSQKKSIQFWLIESRREFWPVLLRDLVEDPELRAAFRVALMTEGDLNND